MRIAVDQHTHIRHVGTFFAGFGDVFADIDDVSIGDPVKGMFLESNYVADGSVTRIDPERKLIWFTLDYQNAYSE